jgi:hypothetical protein
MNVLVINKSTLLKDAQIVLPGGYVSVYTPGRGWRQMGAKKGGRVVLLGNDPKHKAQFGRLTKYGRDRPARLGWDPED